MIVDINGLWDFERNHVIIFFPFRYLPEITPSKALSFQLSRGTLQLRSFETALVQLLIPFKYLNTKETPQI